MRKRVAVIIGAGPAGLTAAYELLSKTDVMPVVLEQSEYMGGISRTVNYKGNRIDIGGHRFFSKSDRVMDWWLSILPMEGNPDGAQIISYQSKTRAVSGSTDGPDPTAVDAVMLVRPRKSRIYFLRRFFDYPIRLSTDTVLKLGPVRMAKIGTSYVWNYFFPIRPERNLEEFFINRFGRELYLTFFKSYTEKVWGESCRAISAEWGRQRVKGLSIKATLRHAFQTAFRRKPPADIAQKQTETSLIERFLYPKHGPGQMWEEVARRVSERGGQILTGMAVEELVVEGDRIAGVWARSAATGERQYFEADFVFSTMPVRELMRAMSDAPPEEVMAVSDGLLYRDFITVGLLVSGMKIYEHTENGAKLIKDNWVYIQEPDVLVGRLQVFNNWSPYMVAQPGTVWLGLEYFCYDSDPIWSKPDDELIALGTEELRKIGIIEREAVLDATVLRMPKTYPAYFGTYDRFDEVRRYLQRYQNLFLVGRNGMHKYNNQDHSMLTAMVAVENIAAGRTDQSNIWSVNTEQEYHESK
jgi:protoporphyrinogen oxidase